MKKIKVFVDSDVIISSLLSSKGAAHFLLNQTDLELYISDISYRELEKVGGRLGIEKSKLQTLIKNKFKKIQLKTDLAGVKDKFKKYILDQNDAHIVAGVYQAKARFLISYNIKDFKAEIIKQDFNIITTTPARLLQYLRSIS